MPTELATLPPRRRPDHSDARAGRPSNEMAIGMASGSFASSANRPLGDPDPADPHSIPHPRIEARLTGCPRCGTDAAGVSRRLKRPTATRTTGFLDRSTRLASAVSHSPPSLRERRVTRADCGSLDPTDRNGLMLELRGLNVGLRVRGLLFSPSGTSVVARAWVPALVIVSVRPGEVLPSGAARPEGKERP